MSATANINIRTTPDRRDLIDQAARALGRNRSEFVLDAAETRAREVLLDQTMFALDEDAHQRFMDLLEQPLPAQSQAAIARLLAHRAPWE